MQLFNNYAFYQYLLGTYYVQSTTLGIIDNIIIKQVVSLVSHL